MRGYASAGVAEVEGNKALKALRAHEMTPDAAKEIVDMIWATPIGGHGFGARCDRLRDDLKAEITGQTGEVYWNGEWMTRQEKAKRTKGVRA